jgi:hypothetical protein
MNNRLSYRIQYEIARALEYHGACSLDELVDALPDFSWNQVFLAVDSMSRDGSLRLVHRHPGRCLPDVLQHHREPETGD